ncbi:PilZ domain-containing protein [Pseudomonas saliphila]|uniref:PilZ domain-containing protein n=1 Tax=Pseudomonas saliphila TaxID=2586906 RepID=UPI00123906C0|nr:PilZ domain-containing protein [Pseudomonas saliphila]
MQLIDESNQDKRDFYRIEDQLALDYRVINGPDLADAHFGSSQFQMLSELQVLEQESQHLLRQISERDRSLGGYLKIMNKRIELIARTLVSQATDTPTCKLSVTLSEGGMSFAAAERLDPETWLALRIVLMPTPLGLVVPARVLRCDPVPNGEGWTIGVSFEALSDPERQLLAKHILQKQAQEIRAAKTERTHT